jgi:hypothetical protein
MAKVKQVLNFTVTAKGKPEKTKLELFANVDPDFYAHMAECSDCRAEIAKNLREFAAQVEANVGEGGECGGGVAGRVQAGAE